MPSRIKQRTIGWGDPGAPGSAEEARWKRLRLVKVTAAPDVKTLWVNRAVREQMAALVLFMEHRGVPLGRTVDDWGFANRLIRGSASEASYHRWGLAIDLDATANPMGVRRESFTKTQKDLADLRGLLKLLGLGWGYDYRGRPDPMHFEFGGSHARARWIAYRLRRPTWRSRKVAALCGLTVQEFCAIVGR